MTVNPNDVTVVVPTRNRAEKIMKCLEALDRQTLQGFRTVIVNDGATDETRELLEAASGNERKHNLTLIHHDDPMGANRSRNDAIAVSTTTIVAFLDDDCEPKPDWLERLMKAFESPEVAAASGHVENVARSNIWEQFFIGQQRVTSTLRDGVRHARRLVGCNMAVRRVYLDGALDEGRAEVAPDVETSARGDEEGLLIRLRKENRIITHVPDAVVLHDHPYTFASFRRQAFKSGRSTARLAKMYGLSPRWELICLLLAIAFALPSIIWSPLWLLVTACGGLFFAAVSYNELALKGKTPIQWLKTIPALLIYFALRSFGYALEWFGGGKLG